MGDELGTADAPPFPAPAAEPALVIIDENSRGFLLRRITEEGGFAFVKSIELAAAGDLRSAEAAREMAWEQLHSGPWDEVVLTWRDAYAMACLFVADMRASAGDLKEALRVLDMGLIMGGPMLRRELEVAVGKIGLMSASNEVECSRRSNGWGLESSRSWNLDEVLQILPSRSLSCKVVEKQPSPSLETFVRDYFLRSYPVIISNYIDHWPARTKWKDVNYLRSIAGGRTVPVEVGKNYLSSDWKQELITFSQFLDRMQTNISSANLAYLAQHPLFDQIQELRNDIMIPDYCYAGGGELQSLNAWFGPIGTVTPLHYDPHHNIFAQVVGRKYVRLYPESASQDLYPHTESMLRNSSQTYEEEPSSQHPYIRLDRNLMKSCSRFMPIGNAKSSELVKFDTKSVNGVSSLNNEKSVHSTEILSNTSSYLDQKHMNQTAPGAQVLKSSRKNATGDSITCTVFDTGKHGRKNIKQTKFKSFGGTVTSLDKQPSLLSQLKGKGPTLSSLFHRTKKKSKPRLSTNTIESEDLSQLLKEWGVFSLEMLKNELQEANEKRHFALTEVAQMRSSLGDLQHKLSSLESYCEELKMALKQENLGKDNLVSSKSKRTKQKSNSGSSKDDPMPVSHEVMVEDFIQIVSEVRISVNHFCKTLISLIDETDCNLMEKLSILFHQNPLTLDKKNSKEVLCLLEALINQYLYQDFENCVFQKNGSPKVLDPHQNRLENFTAFISFRNMSWNDVLRKGTKYYSEDFSLFCDQKMSSIVSILNWWRPWPELLLHSFFVSAKCIWLLHLLAFSFNPPAIIFRVNENRRFDPLYMEDVFRDKQQPAETLAQVKFMVMPGFYVKDRVLRCRVVCEYGAF